LSDDPPGFVIRRATVDDAACIAALGMQVFLDTYATKGVWPSIARDALGGFSLASIQFQLANTTGFFLVVEQGNCIVAFAQVARPMHEKPDGAIYIERFYVQEPFTRKGLGKALLLRVEAIGRAEGATAITLVAWAGNPRALGFYASQGYADVGESVYTFEDESYENRKFLKVLGPTA
jgi:diamine N-acetyltransferase